MNHVFNMMFVMVECQDGKEVATYLHAKLTKHAICCPLYETH